MITSDFGSVAELDSFVNLVEVMKSVSPTSTASAGYTPTTSLPACPRQLVTEEWNISTILPPTPYEPLCSCMHASLHCVIKSTPYRNSSFYDSWLETPTGWITLEDMCEGWDNCRAIHGDLGLAEFGGFRYFLRSFSGWSFTDINPAPVTFQRNGPGQLTSTGRDTAATTVPAISTR